MKHECILVEKIELETYPPEDGGRLIKTWRSFFLLKGDDATYPVAFGEKCDEILLDTIGKIRIGGERFIEELDLDENEPLSSLRPLPRNLKDENLSDTEYVVYEQKQFNKMCAEHNKPTMQQVERELQRQRKLPNIVANNSDNRVLLMYLENVLYLFVEWYERVNIKPPVDVNKFWPIEQRNDSVALSGEQTKIDQDSIMEKFLEHCKVLNLAKGKTIPNEILYSIGMKIFPDRMPKLEDFKDGNSVYHILRKYGADTGHKRGKKT